jgi:4-hydroxy-tetrahydrodipicolinate synthase
MSAADVDFGRLVTAMVTPFDEAGDVDFAQAGRLAVALVENGTDTLVVSGTTGESPTLTNDEKLRLFEAVKVAVGDRARVIGGTCNYSTRESIELTHAAESLLDGVLMVVPYYNNPPQEGLYRHFRAIAEHTALPCVLYNVPSRTVRNMEAATTIRLAGDVPNIVGLKEASGSMDQVAEIIAGVPSQFRVWSGNDQDTFGVMCLGGYGVVSVASHIVGRQIRRMVDLLGAGRTAEGAALHLRLLPLAKALFPPLSPIASPSAIKAAINLLGFSVGGLRLPLIALPEAAETKLRSLLATFDVDPLPVTAKV